MQAFHRHVVRLGQRHPVERIPVKIFARRNERRMRRDEPDIQDPWIAVRFSFGHQPFGGMVRDAAIVEVIVRHTDANVLDQAKRRIEGREGIAQGAPDHADAIDDVHRFVLPVESKRIFRAAEVHFPDRFDRMSGALHLPGPTFDFPVVGMGIVPTAGFVHVTPGRE